MHREYMLDSFYEKHTEHYGADPCQEGDLYIPRQNPIAVVCLFHGGFWRMPYDREQLTPMAVDFATKGFAVWNIEYRRIGAEGGGWRGTLDDAIASVDHLAALQEKYGRLDLSKVIIAGHSAGGHLALWCAKQLKITPCAVIGLAPIIDLEKAFHAGAGNNAVAALLNGSPVDHPERYEQHSPMTMLPMGVPQLIIHGTHDEYLDVEWTRTYVRSARDAGDTIDYLEIADGGHMDFLDPQSVAISSLHDWISNAITVI